MRAGCCAPDSQVPDERSVRRGPEGSSRGSFGIAADGDPGLTRNIACGNVVEVNPLDPAASERPSGVP